jgi:hypothetical protein
MGATNIEWNAGQIRTQRMYYSSFFLGLGAGAWGRGGLGLGAGGGERKADSIIS